MKDRRHRSRPSIRSDAGTKRSPMIPGRVSNQSEPGPETLRVRWAAWYANTSPIWKFALKFGALMTLFYGLILTPYFDQLLYSYLSANAWVTNGILNCLVQETSVAEITVRSVRFAITVRRGCDAVEPSWFLCAALLAFPAPFKRKVLGILVGVALLQMLNLIRIVSLFFIGLNYPRFFGPAHVEVWPIVFIITAIGLWIGWISWSRQPASTTTHAAP